MAKMKENNNSKSEIYKKKPYKLTCAGGNENG